MSVQTIHFGWGGGRVCENQHFFRTLLTLWPDFYCFRGDFWDSKNVDVYSFFWRWGKGSQKVYVLYTYDNVDTYGRPLALTKLMLSVLSERLNIYVRDGVIADAPRCSNLGDIPSSPTVFPSSSNCNCFSTKFKLTGGMVNCLFGTNLEDIKSCKTV